MHDDIKSKSLYGKVTENGKVTECRVVFGLNYLVINNYRGDVLTKIEFDNFDEMSLEWKTEGLLLKKYYLFISKGRNLNTKIEIDKKTSITLDSVINDVKKEIIKTKAEMKKKEEYELQLKRKRDYIEEMIGDIKGFDINNTTLNKINIEIFEKGSTKEIFDLLKIITVSAMQISESHAECINKYLNKKDATHIYLSRTEIIEYFFRKEDQIDSFDGIGIYAYITHTIEKSRNQHNIIKVNVRYEEILVYMYIRFGNKSLQDQLFIQNLYSALNQAGIVVPWEDVRGFSDYVIDRITIFKNITIEHCYKDDEGGWTTDYYRSTDVALFKNYLFFKNNSNAIFITLPTDVCYDICIEPLEKKEFDAEPDYEIISPDMGGWNLEYRGNGIDEAKEIFEGRYALSFYLVKEDGYVASMQDDISFKLELDEVDTKRAIKFFKRLNTELFTDINELLTQIEMTTSIIDENMKIIVENYVDMFPREILQQWTYYTKFELYLSWADKYMRRIIDTPKEMIETNLKELSNDEAFVDYLSSYITGDFEKFKSIVVQLVAIPIEIHNCVVWTLIRNEAKINFASTWDKVYGYVFGDIVDESREWYIEKFCKTNEIKHKDANIVGLLTYKLMSIMCFPDDINNNFIRCNMLMINEVLTKLDEIEVQNFQNKLKRKKTFENSGFDIADIDMLNGYEFEEFVGKLFTKLGYKTEITKSSGDQGLDVLAVKNELRVGIQAKCYTGKVGNKAVQEIVAALGHYNCSKGIVITNQYFTDSAIELAKSNDILLWDRDILKSKIEEVF